MLSVHDVAQKLKVSDQQVRTILRKGELDAEMVGKQWIIQSSALDKYISEFDVTIEPDDHARLSDDIPKVVALSFFSGAMGLDIGMKNAGIEALLACEFDKACRMTIDKNNPDIALIGDINNYTAGEILELAKIPKNRKVDVIFGGPPCQAFSTAGNRKGFEDNRGNVFLKYLDIVSDIKSRYVVIENVRGLLSAAFPYSETLNYDECINAGIEPIKGGALLHIIDRLRSAGYTVSFELYNAANFGAPQIRERVVIIASLGKKRVPYIKPTNAQDGKYGLPTWKTLGDALSRLSDDTIHHHVDFPECRLKYYRMLSEGQYWKNLPLELQKEAMGNSFGLGGGKTGFYRRLSYSKPSPTLVTHPAMPATDLGHPVEDRPLSVEEYSCIQGFPETWDICGSMLDQYKQIGNAVPIKLGEAIGNTILAHMNGGHIEQYPGFRYSRYRLTDDISWEKETRKQLQADEVEQLSFAV
ncbi:cytosine-specific methyltransferase [Clostridia bacterium]|nr:cytosine-specific methyltransferase [Clostridia bacterium]